MNESKVVQLRGVEGPANDGSNQKCGPPRGSKLVDIRFLIAYWPMVSTVGQHRTSRPGGVDIVGVVLSCHIKRIERYDMSGNQQ